MDEISFHQMTRQPTAFCAKRRTQKLVPRTKVGNLTPARLSSLNSLVNQYANIPEKKAITGDHRGSEQQLRVITAITPDSNAPLPHGFTTGESMALTLHQ